MDDLSMDAMLNMLPRVEAGADVFTDKVMARLRPDRSRNDSRNKSQIT